MSLQGSCNVLRALSADSGGRRHNESRSADLSPCCGEKERERERERGGNSTRSTLPPVCIASIADIASSPSGHKICRTSLATLVTFRTPNSALHRFLCFAPSPPCFAPFLCRRISLPVVEHRYRSIRTTYLLAHARNAILFPCSYSYLSSTTTPNYFESNLTETCTAPAPSRASAIGRHAGEIHAPRLCFASLVSPMMSTALISYQISHISARSGPPLSKRIFRRVCHPFVFSTAFCPISEDETTRTGTSFKGRPHRYLFELRCKACLTNIYRIYDAKNISCPTWMLSKDSFRFPKDFSRSLKFSISRSW